MKNFWSRIHSAIGIGVATFLAVFVGGMLLFAVFAIMLPLLYDLLMFQPGVLTEAIRQKAVVYKAEIFGTIAWAAFISGIFVGIGTFWESRRPNWRS